MVVVHCDNAGAVAAVNSGYSRVPHLLQCLFLYEHTITWLSGPQEVQHPA
jgi:hypothetical protein